MSNHRRPRNFIGSRLAEGQIRWMRNRGLAAPMDRIAAATRIMTVGLHKLTGDRIHSIDLRPERMA